MKVELNFNDGCFRYGEFEYGANSGYPKMLKVDTRPLEVIDKEHEEYIKKKEASDKVEKAAFNKAVAEGKEPKHPVQETYVPKDYYKFFVNTTNNIYHEIDEKTMTCARLNEDLPIPPKPHVSQGAK